MLHFKKKKIKLLLGKGIPDSWQDELPTKEILPSPEESATAIKQQGLNKHHFLWNQILQLNI